MTPRLATGVLVSALIRRVEHAGGTAAVLARGDREAGAVMLVIAERGATRAVLERALGPDGRYGWIDAAPRNANEPGALTDFFARRRRSDPDLWIVELDSPAARAIADEVVSP